MNKLVAFKKHLVNTVFGENGLMDSLNNGNYEERFDVTIEVNGEKITLDLHSELYESLTNLIDREIEEEEE